MLNTSSCSTILGAAPKLGRATRLSRVSGLNVLRMPQELAVGYGLTLTYQLAIRSVRNYINIFTIILSQSMETTDP